MITATDGATVVIAAIAAGAGAVGAVTGVASLWRQARFERRSGPDVVVRSSVGITAIPRIGVLTVRASNAGRGAIQVTAWGFRLPDGRSIFVPHPMQGSSPLPLTLEGGHQGRWSMEVTPGSPVVGINDAQDTDLIPYVDLGDGSTVEGQSQRLGRGALRRLVTSN